MSQAINNYNTLCYIHFIRKTARQEKFYSDLRNEGSLELTKYYCVSAVTMPIKLSSDTTWSTSDAVASVQLQLNYVFFCLAEVLSHMIFDINASALYGRH